MSQERTGDGMGRDEMGWDGMGWGTHADMQPDRPRDIAHARALESAPLELRRELGEQVEERHPVAGLSEVYELWRAPGPGAGYERGGEGPWEVEEAEVFGDLARDADAVRGEGRDAEGAVEEREDAVDVRRAVLVLVLLLSLTLSPLHVVLLLFFWFSEEQRNWNFECGCACECCCE